MNDINPSSVSPKSYWLVLINALALGFLGAHRFAVGKWKSAILQLVTVGGLGVWLAIDLLTILRGRFTDSNGLIIPNSSKAPSWIVSVIMVLAISTRLGHHYISESSASTTDSTPDRAPTADSAAAIAIPAEEKAFIEIVRGYITSYGDAANELKKSAVRVSRKQKLQELVSTLEFKGWIGRIDEMTTTSKGNAALSIKLSNGSLMLQTYNNELSDLGDDTLIPINSDLFNRVANLKTGMTVKVSGNFLADDQDFIKEGSITEEGSMTEPEFIVKFTQVEPAQ